MSTESGETRPALTIRLPATFAAFRHRNFRLYWFGNMISFTGTWMQNVAKSWLVLSVTNSPFFVGLDSAMNWLPVWLVSLPAGVLADRFSKRNLMLITQSVLAFFALLLAILTWTRVINIYQILAISFLAGIFVALNAPVAQTLVPDLVNRKDVLNAIALNSSMFNLARMVGPAIAGSLLTFSGPAPVFAINAASFLAIILALALIRLDKPVNNIQHEPILTQLITGLRYVRSHPDIRLLILLIGIFSSFGIVYIPLLPVIARDVLGQGARGYGLMMTSLGAGAVTGGLTLATLSKTRHRGKILLAGTLTLGILLLIFSFCRSYQFALILLLLVGFCQTSIASLTNTLIQTLAPDYIRGRVMSIFSLFFNGMFPLGSLIGGAIAQRWGTCPALLVAGIVVLTTLALVMLIRPQLRHI
ncbi:MAG: MFS transporter [candidate division WOR-3 bacterium]|uniref:MFS transporter n=1 Tax=candidate division WOR-3 bacterium TaxID=2052148 RepID=A0A7C1SF25_UNCW3|nr:MFS transporter [candidate division WOR-3 bacterium]